MGIIGLVWFMIFFVYGLYIDFFGLSLLEDNVLGDELADECDICEYEESDDELLVTLLFLEKYLVSLFF